MKKFKELWNKSSLILTLILESNEFYFFFQKPLLFPLFFQSICTVSFCQQREKQVKLSVVSESEMTQFPRFLQGGAISPRMTFMRWEQRGR